MGKDAEEGVIFASRVCSAPGFCDYSSVFPLQNWRGRMPIEIIFPLKVCRIGSWEWRAPCPNLPLQFLNGWNEGEYERQSTVPLKSGRSSEKEEAASAAFNYSSYLTT